MSLINLGAGLSSMGAGVAQYAQTMGVEQQKADLETKMAVLTNNLATQRETALQGQRQTFEQGQTQKQFENTTALQKSGSDLAVKQAADIAQAQVDLEKRNAADPDFVKAQQVLADAKATPEQRAQASYYMTKSREPLILPPGSTALDPNTREPLYTAPSSFGNTPESAALRAFQNEHPDASAEEIQAFLLRGKAARSPASAAMQKYMSDHPNATAEELTTFGANFKAQGSAATSFASGSDAKFIDSINSAAGHAQALKQLGTALQNGDVPLFNKVANAWATATGEPAPGNFDTLKNIVGGEIVKAIVGAGGGESDRAAAKATLDAAKSPEQLAGAADTLIAALHTQVESRALKFQATKQGTLQDFVGRLTPTAQATFGYGSGAANPDQGQSPAPGSPSATTPGAPALPRGVPGGSQYSPSRNMWRDPQGKLYNSDGTKVQ